MDKEDKLLEALLKSTSDCAEIKHSQERDIKEIDAVREQLELQGKNIAFLEASLKGLGESLDQERKLNRDRQLDFSKLLEDKIGTLYKGVSILTAIISLVISLIHNFFSK